MSAPLLKTVFGRVRESSGFGILEVLVSTVIFGILVGAGSMLLHLYTSKTFQAIQMGEVEDLRRFLRDQLDCDRTLLLEQTACSNGEYIHGHTSKGVPIVTSAQAGRPFADYIVRIQCRVGAQSTNLSPEYFSTRKPNEGWKPLFGVPVACNTDEPPGPPVGCELDALMANADVDRIARQRYTRPRNFVRTNAPPTVRINDPFGWRAVQRFCATATGENRISTTNGSVHFDATSAARLCRCLGYQDVVSRSCNQPYGYGDGCGNSSPWDNTMGYYQQIGGVWNWRIRPATLDNRWLGTMTCGTPICR